MLRWVTIFLLMFLTTFTSTPLSARQTSFFDVHIHYSHDVWDSLSPEAAVARLRQAGISRAMVSSSGDAGTRRLYQAAPDLVIPALRPYRQRSDLNDWMHDDSVISYLEKKLRDFPYLAIGEFHLEGEEADLPVVRKMVQLARQHDLILHAHVDANAIYRLYDQYPDARILWAHAGFEHAATVEELMDTYPNLWADLSFRWDVHPASQFLPGWKEVLIKHSDRFMFGVDTYTPERWDRIQDTLAWYERLFANLPGEVADRIRYHNANQLIGERFEQWRKNP